MANELDKYLPQEAVDTSNLAPKAQELETLYSSIKQDAETYYKPSNLLSNYNSSIGTSVFTPFSDIRVNCRTNHVDNFFTNIPDY